MTLQRMREGVPNVRLSAAGYRAIHRHLLQDWAGRYRTVNIAKGGDMYCLVPHIAGQMEARFVPIRAGRGKRLSREGFAARAAEHACEINAVHPFREENGRRQRAFPERLAAKAGHAIDLRLIGPAEWSRASIESFRQADCQVVLAAIA
jgi:cell filamentation protein